MYLNGLWKKLPKPSARVLLGEAVSALQARAVLQLTVAALAHTLAAAVSAFVFHFSRKRLNARDEKFEPRREIKMIIESYKKAHASHSE